MSDSPEFAIDNFLEKHAVKYAIPRCTLRSLQDYGVMDARILSILTKEEIFAIPGISERTAESLSRVAHDQFRGKLFKDGNQLAEYELTNVHYLTTGSKEIDTLLNGGIKTGTITEIIGEYRSGKTQLCMTCAVTAQLPFEQGGLNTKVIYIDTKNSFNIEHYSRIGKRFGLERDNLLKNIYIARGEQMRYFSEAIDRLPGYLQALDCRLIVIDSPMAPIEQEYTTLREYPVVQKLLQKLLGLWKRIALGFNCAVIFTNHVERNLEPTIMQYHPFVYAGDHAIAHRSDVRLVLRKLKENMRRIKVEACAWLPNEQTDFYLTSHGVYDEKTFPSEQNLEEVLSVEDFSEEFDFKY